MTLLQAKWKIFSGILAIIVILLILKINSQNNNIKNCHKQVDSLFKIIKVQKQIIKKSSQKKVKLNKKIEKLKKRKDSISKRIIKITTYNKKGKKAKKYEKEAYTKISKDLLQTDIRNRSIIKQTDTVFKKRKKKYKHKTKVKKEKKLKKDVSEFYLKTNYVVDYNKKFKFYPAISLGYRQKYIFLYIWGEYTKIKTNLKNHKVSLGVEMRF